MFEILGLHCAPRISHISEQSPCEADDLNELQPFVKTVSPCKNLYKLLMTSPSLETIVLLRTTQQFMRPGFLL